MPAKKKTDDQKETTEVSMEQLLKTAGFGTVVRQTARVLHASGAKDFSKAHAEVIQRACNCPELQGCSRYDCTSGLILIVHRNVDAVSSPRSEPDEKRGEDTASTEETESPKSKA